MSARQELLDHLGQGVTTVCRAWLVIRRDGTQFGFTDHDLDLGFEGRRRCGRPGRPVARPLWKGWNAS